MASDKMDAVDRLAQAIEKAGFTQASLERMADYHSGYLSKIIRRSRSFSPNLAARLAPFLNVSTEWILTGEGALVDMASDYKDYKGRLCRTCRLWGDLDDAFRCRGGTASGEWRTLKETPQGSAAFLRCSGPLPDKSWLRTGPEFGCVHWKPRGDVEGS